MDKSLEYRLVLCRMEHYVVSLFRDLQAGYIVSESFTHGLRTLWYLELISDSEYFFWNSSLQYPYPNGLQVVQGVEQ